MFFSDQVEYTNDNSFHSIDIFPTNQPNCSQIFAIQYIGVQISDKRFFSTYV